MFTLQLGHRDTADTYHDIPRTDTIYLRPM